VLSLLTAGKGRTLSAAQLLAACGLLGVSDNATRVSLSRLRREGRIAQAERGSYRLGAASFELAELAGAWRSRARCRRSFHGQYLALLTADLRRGDRTTIRRREHAIEVSGMRTWRHGLALRPDNLDGQGRALTERLKTLGFPDAVDMVTVSLNPDQEVSVCALWDVAAYEREAKRLTLEVHKFLRAGERLSTERRAKQSFWLGDEVIRFLLRDPLLPETWCDPSLVTDLTQAMEELDLRGHAVWADVLAEVGVRLPRRTR